MPQHTMETWAWPQWVLFILLYFLFLSLGKCPVWACVLLLGCVAKLSSRFIYADSLYMRVGRGLFTKSLHLEIFLLKYPSNSPQLAKLNMAVMKNPTLMLNQSIATANCIGFSFLVCLHTWRIFTQTHKYVFWKKLREMAKSRVALIQDFCGTVLSADIGRS